jgi:hypothetical protein
MGGGTWSSASYDTYARTTNYQTAPQEKVFSRYMNAALDPRNIRVGAGPNVGRQLRESCDSPENPKSTPIILGLDVTGSMGEIAEQIAKIELPKLMTQIHETSVVKDPHVMFMGLDDVYAQGHGALQVSQFEPDIRIVEQLRQMWLVKNGGGNGSESYDLAWYFAANYTVADSYEKRGNRGFLFTFGDEPAPFQTMSTHDLETIFGPGQYESAKPADSLRAAQEKYRVFHIIVERGGRDRKTHASWTEMLGDNAIFLRNPAYLTEVVLATMCIANGEDIHEVINSSDHPDTLTYAFQNALQG